MGHFVKVGGGSPKKKKKKIYALLQIFGLEVCYARNSTASSYSSYHKYMGEKKTVSYYKISILLI